MRLLFATGYLWCHVEASLAAGAACIVRLALQVSAFVPPELMRTGCVLIMYMFKRCFLQWHRQWYHLLSAG